MQARTFKQWLVWTDPTGEDSELYGTGREACGATREEALENYNNVCVGTAVGEIEEGETTSDYYDVTHIAEFDITVSDAGVTTTQCGPVETITPPEPEEDDTDEDSDHEEEGDATAPHAE